MALHSVTAITKFISNKFSARLRTRYGTNGLAMGMAVMLWIGDLAS